ncbi:MAG: hypothetical protein JXR07_01760 [Reichenbachiella sp.]
MKHTFNLLIAMLCIVHLTHGQIGNYTMGARSASLAGSSVTLMDQWSSFNNIGALSYVEDINIFATYKNLYGLPELSSMAVGVTLPVWIGTATLGAYRFGGDLLNDHRVHAGFSNRFGIVSLGANFSYFQLNIEGGGTQTNFLFDFGGHAKLSEQFYFGAHISNVNQAKLSDLTGEKISTIMKTGLSYRPNEHLMINSEIEKSIDDDFRIKIGIEYEIINSVFARTGILTSPFNSNFGIGFEPGQISVDYAFGMHQDLGDFHQFSFTYRISKK